MINKSMNDWEVFKSTFQNNLEDIKQISKNLTKLHKKTVVKQPKNYKRRQ
jgi:hypothetical protein